MKQIILSAVLITMLAACNNSNTATDQRSSYSDSSSKTKDIREEAVSYNIGDSVFNGYLTYDHNDTSKRASVLIVHEWWGVNDYVRNRAKQLADLGYVAMVVDMFGAGQTAPDPQTAQKLTTPFYENPALAQVRLDAAKSKLLSYNIVDPAKISAIGYCFGGFVVLNAAKLGSELKSVVSFHGGLGGVPAKPGILKAAILICHGAADNFVPQQEIDAFKRNMDSVGAIYSIKVYPEATHAFTNPDATATGEKFKLPIQYNAAADSASWADMKAFLK